MDNQLLEQVKTKIEAVNNIAATIPPETVRWLSLLDQAYINPAEPITKPPVCLWIKGQKGDSIIGSLGNFSMIIGKAKSRKTFMITAALAAATKHNSVLNFIGTLPDNQSNVIYFDTEQGKYHAYKTVERVCTLSGIEMPENFKGYGLRPYPPAERLKMIETALYNTPGLGFVCIDGARDLVSSINDEEQATMLTSLLLKWTAELNIHIIVVLHQNKSDQNARGHLGSELQNKAETTLSVTKDIKNKDISIVEAEYCRDKEPEPFAFEIFNGLPLLVTDWEVKTNKAGGAKKVTPDEIPLDTHVKVLKEVFKTEPKPLANSLYSNMTVQFKKLFNLDIRRNKAIEFVTYYKAEGLLSVNETPKTKDRFHVLNDIQQITNESEPF
ncbi:MAG: AAA family ATPase [Lentimicrobiaceae bacterium]|nr:AAA family ATPase [Lentimicrobiaceae bacterium]